MSTGVVIKKEENTVKRLLIALFIILLVLLTACGNKEWLEFDYSDPEAKFKAEQMIKIEDDDKFEDYFECRVWATKRTLGVVLPTTRQEYFEGYIAIPDDFDIYIFVYDIKSEYKYGDYTDCKVIDFNDTPYEEFKEHDGYKGHYRIDKIQIKVK
jgi:predicted small lipoprotein YifL